MYVFFLLDWYGMAFSLMVIGVLESIVFCWIYGECMVGFFLAAEHCVLMDMFVWI